MALLTNPWTMLVAAGLLEVMWAVSMKQSHGFTRLGPSVVTLVALAASMTLLALALRTLPVGTAYAVWTGIGAVGAVLMGIVLLGESATPLRLACVAAIVLGILGLKLGGH